MGTGDGSCSWGGVGGVGGGGVMKLVVALGGSGRAAAVVVWARAQGTGHRAQGSSANGRASQRPCACPVLSAKAAPLLKPPQTDLVCCSSSCSSRCSSSRCCCSALLCAAAAIAAIAAAAQAATTTTATTTTTTTTATDTATTALPCFLCPTLPYPTQPCPAQPASAQLRSVLLFLLCRDSSSFACHRQPPGPLPPSLPPSPNHHVHTRVVSPHACVPVSSRLHLESTSLLVSASSILAPLSVTELGLVLAKI